MASAVDICNLAVSHVGSDAVVVSISPPDGSVEAGHCARFFGLARRELIETHPWTFAKTRVQLAQVANPSKVWRYAYALPSDCIQPQRVLQVGVLLTAGYWPANGYMTSDQLQLFTERGSSNFEVEDGVLLTHEPEAVLLYTRDVIDTTKYTSSFVAALSYLLASYIAGPTIKGSAGADASARFRALVFGANGQGGLLGKATALDANSSSEDNGLIPEHLRRRT